MIVKSSPCFLFALTVSAQDSSFGFAAVAGQKGKGRMKIFEEY
jgi:hypothetical protein